MATPRIEGGAEEMAAAQIIQGEEAIAAAEVAEEAESFEDLQAAFEEITPPPMKRFDESKKSSLEDAKVRFKKAEAERLAGRLASTEEIDTTAERFAKQNKEFTKEILKLLLDSIKNCKTKEQLLDVLKDFYADATLADDALSFLTEVTRGELQKIAQETADIKLTVKDADLKALVNPLKLVESHAVIGGPAPVEVKRALAAREKMLFVTKSNISKMDKQLEEAENKLETIIDALISVNHHENGTFKNST